MSGGFTSFETGSGSNRSYWHLTGSGTFLFASEVRALLASGLVEPRLDASALPSFLSQQTVPSPQTLMSGVRMLVPGSWLQIGFERGRAGERRLTRYWSPLEEAGFRRDARRRFDRREVGRGLRRRLEAAVEQSIVADVPLGAFLSGGVDSATLVALMSLACDRPVRTFTVAFDEPGYDDPLYAQIVADRFRTEHQEIRVEEADLVDSIPTAVADQDHPSGDGINTWIVSRAAPEGRAHRGAFRPRRR